MHATRGTRGMISVAGSLAQKPGHGGHTWVFLQYLLGLRRLGWDVLFLDHLPEADGPSPGPQYVRNVMRRFGLGSDHAVLTGSKTIGLDRAEVLERVRRSAFVLNVMGFLRDEEVLAAAPRRIFLDIDPGFGQMWKELALADIFAGHDAFVTIGQNIGLPGCVVPTCGLNWITTPQPVVLEQWPPVPPPAGAQRAAMTSVVSWRGAFGPIEYQGKTYGLRVHEFRKFVALPRMTSQRFELALSIHPDEVMDLALLDANGWERVDPKQVAGDPDDYRRYIARSKGELMIAKNLYVETRGGWFSDRSICYLASGRPVLAQDTGLRHRYPSGEGLVLFSTLEGAAAGVEEINRNYARHCRAAREIAEMHFDSDKVLTNLLRKLGVT